MNIIAVPMARNDRNVSYPVLGFVEMKMLP